jgi:hypothetical protein
MPTDRTVVITSIAGPNAVMQAIARQVPGRLIVVGDTKSPETFELAGAHFLSLRQQLECGLRFARLCPQRHYARKNVGYLKAIAGGARVIQETDDDNMPEDGFFAPVARQFAAPVLRGTGWSNVYHYFSDLPIWPRGLPLEEIHAPLPAFADLPVETVDCPIQQGLASGNPDVDAVFRLTAPAEVAFHPTRRMALSQGAWCPFNSQNTVWFADAFPLLYLPAYCSFRMTDIWRSFVAQRIAWENGWSVLFHHATVYQERNVHDLMRDFADEIPGYLNNQKIKAVLSALTLAPGTAAIGANLVKCYQALIGLGVVGEQELSLLEAWTEDLARVAPPALAQT